MTLVALVSWWYTAGWAGIVGQAGKRSSRILEAFSVMLLAGSLFEPFRQISAAQTRGGSLDMQMRAMADRLFSRVFGAVIRSLFICIGLFAALFAVIFSFIELAVWPIIPFLPIAGILLALLKVGL